MGVNHLSRPIVHRRTTGGSPPVGGSPLVHPATGQTKEISPVERPPSCTAVETAARHTDYPAGADSHPVAVSTMTHERRLG